MMEISEGGKKEALALARWVLEAEICGSKAPKPQPKDALLNEKRGTFVTLRKEGELRGCVGRIEPLFILQDEIVDLAVGAATRDPRFPAISSVEVARLTVEISILTPPVVVKTASGIRIGEDGLIIEKDLRRGLLLPQVATEEGWDVESFLDHACLKAGLPTDSWKSPDTAIYRFSAAVFSE
ncbi:MAG: AmmeMemoRadiSam system protein A [Candidatus Neomarinimicrobiota bacterium]